MEVELKKYLYGIIGDKNIHWKSCYNRHDDMTNRGTIKAAEVISLITHVDNINDVTKLLEERLEM